MPKRSNALAAAFVAAVAVAGCEPKPPVQSAAVAAPRVRVRLLAGVDRVTLRSPEAVPLVDARTRAASGLNLAAGRDARLTLDGKTWRLDDWALPARGPLSVEPPERIVTVVNGQPYRGVIEVVDAGDGKLDVINDVDIDTYLRGVLARELLPDWQPEAYRAQAVIARTYALYEARTRPPGRAWDLYPDERSQVYGGASAETPKADAAVAATRGLVTAFGPAGQERIFKAYFSSCCGGVSASAADVFNDAPTPPLSAKSNGRTCAISTRFDWPPVTLAKAELTRRVRAWAAKSGRPEADLPGVRTIAVHSVNAFGRPRGYVLTDTRGNATTLTAEQLRWAVNTDPDGGPTLLSGYFRPVDAGDAVRFADGHGFGHGVGACQWCMQARALAGEPFAAIVTHAYPQSNLVRAYD